MVYVDTICQVVMAFSAAVATAGYLTDMYSRRVDRWYEGLNLGTISTKTSFWDLRVF